MLPGVQIEFYINPETGEPEIYLHSVDEDEVSDVLFDSLEDVQSRDGTRSAFGQTSNGRWLRVIYVKKGRPRFYFVITAYTPGPKAVRSLRRRLHKKK